MTGALAEPVAASPDDLVEGWKRTSPAGIIARGVSSIGQAILPTLAVMFGSSVVNEGFLVGLLVGSAVITVGFLAGAIGWWKTQYRIGASDIRVHKGLVRRSARSVPFERIQDVSLEERLLPRLLGLVEVRFETGAGGKDELKLAYVTHSEGEALRETVRARLDADRPGANDLASAATPSHEHPVLFAMDTPRLLLFGLFEFSLVAFAVLAGAAQQFEFLLPFDPWDFDSWDERLAGVNGWLGAWLVGLGWAARVVGLLLALAVLLAVGLATGILRTFAREYGFRLERTAKGFRRRRGLLTRTDVVMPVHRVQALTVSTGLLRRWWGWHGLAFISLAQDAGSANHVVAPFAKMAELTPIARAAGFALPGKATQWRRPSPRYRIDRAVLSAALMLPAVVAALVMDQVLLALGALAVGAFLSLRQMFLWRHERHALEESQVLARTGWLRPSLVIATRAKLHSVEIVHGPLARRRGYATVKFGLAGGKLQLPGLPLAAARSLAADVLDSIAAVDFSQLPR